MRAALLAAALLCATSVGVAAETPTPDADARAIVLGALERAARNVEEGVELRYHSLMVREIRRYDSNGRVEETVTGGYEVVPIDGARYERRLTVDGRALNAEEQEGERRREADFREARHRARESGEDERDDDEIVFDEQLIERYEVAFEAEEVFRGRPSYRISFEPRPGSLPVRRRSDHALNKARGQIWIDKETYEAARVEFELTGRVRLWWGILGTIMRARGSIDRGPVVGDLWGSLQLETYTDVRVLLRRERRADIRRWHDNELLEQ
jgi:hypothetical protein